MADTRELGKRRQRGNWNQPTQTLEWGGRGRRNILVSCIRPRDSRSPDSGGGKVGQDICNTEKGTWEGLSDYRNGCDLGSSRIGRTPAGGGKQKKGTVNRCYKDSVPGHSKKIRKRK